ncbi:MAG: hypothetical protein IPO91_07605 [Chloroflexi bacterium]|nr:hypothetical protein [Chloroflexota bacterium]
MKQLTFLELAKKVLEEEKRPLSGEEIWQTAQAKGYDVQVATKGKTPIATLGALLYVHMRDNPNSPFLKAGTRPRRFSLKSLFTDQQAEQLVAKQDSAPVKSSYKESALHPFLAHFAHLKLKVYTKTINHSKSTKKEFGEWVHPDMVGCYFPLEDWSREVIDFGTAIGVVSLRLYSFELKRSLNFGNLREAFFQAVSNSSWAHEGYLVAANISEDLDFRGEFQRLSTSFGIGVIELRVDDPNSSDILYPARSKDYLDWETLNKLSSMGNADFQDFLRRIQGDLVGKEVRKEMYDRVLSNEDLLASIVK